MTISLSDLKAKRAAMRADEYHDRYTNAVTYVLEASDDLIEIAEAALAYRDAKAARDAFGAATYKSNPFEILTEDFKERCTGMEAQTRERERALLAALAKIKP